MTPKRWILLLIFYISYLMFGASIYYHIEHQLESEQRADDLKERIQINSYLVNHLGHHRNISEQHEILRRITHYCGKPVTDHRSDEYEPPYTWTFYHAFFFAFTVCSTVGYGNLSPSTTLGRMIVIVYSVIGIPINGILFAGLGEFFSRTLEAIYHRYKEYKMAYDVRYMPPQLGLITTVAIALIPGVTLFIFLPSWVFSYFEDWPFSLAVYYAYVTTTTIGFGDFVPTFQPHQPRKFGGWFIVYEIFIIVWFIFSLGYLLMIMTFITRGLQSKKLAHLEHQLSSNIKATQSRIWHGVTKDVSFLRRILNELYMMKFKPVYTEPDYSHLLHRCNSCPELTIYRTEPLICKRKRAFSECYDREASTDRAVTPLRTTSDTELDKFDRQKSFETADAFRQTTHLLAKVVTVLASVQASHAHENDDVDNDDQSVNGGGGYHGFSDSQILASEWSLHERANNISARKRARACSDFNIHPQKMNNNDHDNEWTWSGDNFQIQQAINDRLRKIQNGRPPSEYVVNIAEEHEQPDDAKKRYTKKFSVPDGLRKMFFFRKRASEMDFRVDVNDYTDRKLSIASVPDQQGQQHVINGTIDHYNTFTSNSNSSILKHLKRRQQPSTTSMFPSLPSFHSDASLTKSLSSRARDAPRIPTNPSPITLRLPTTITEPTALRQRRGSLFTGRTPAKVPPSMRRGSLFPIATQDLDVLESTTLADLIRAIGLMHTEAINNEDKMDTMSDNRDSNGPSIAQALRSTCAANRLYTRRSTVVGTISLPNTNAAIISQRESSNTPRFKRRFSIRPTTLQIPPGKAPLPLPQPTPTPASLSNVTIDTLMNLEKTPSPSTPAPIMRAPFRRRSSLRPSPLARDVRKMSTIASSSDSESGNCSDGTYFNTVIPESCAATIFTHNPSCPPPSPPPPPPVIPSTTARMATHSTHSPLSRKAQLTETQRKAGSPKDPNSEL